MDVNAILYSFRMPLFFLLSGLFFHASLRKNGTENFAITKVNTLLWPYLLWAVIQITLQIFFSQKVNSQRSGLDYLRIFYQPRALDQLWYLFALFNVTMLYLFTEVKLRFRTGHQVVLALVLLGCTRFVHGISVFYDVMLHYVFFVTGTIVADWFSRPETQAKLGKGRNLLVLLPVFAASQFYFLHHQDMNLYLYTVVGLIGSLFTIMLAFLLTKRDLLRFLKVIGNYSLQIYLLHVIIIAGLRMLMLKLGWLTDETVPVVLLVLIPTAIYVSIVVFRFTEIFHLGFLFKGRIPRKAPVQTPSTPSS